VCCQGTDKGEVDQRSDHLAHSAFNVAIWKDFDEAFFKPVMGKQRSVRERVLMGERNFKIDLVEFFANISDGEFIEVVHHFPHGPGGRGYFCPDYLFSFSLKSFLNGYRYTSLIFPWSRC